jgi:hypothetical protein
MPRRPTQGGKANYTGTVLQQAIEVRLVESGYKYIERTKFGPARYLEQPVYTRQFSIGKGIYGTPLYCDFIAYHPSKHADSLIIESKWQQTGGTVDEKYPYLVMNIQYKYPHKTILVLDGNGYRAGAEKWIREQAGPKMGLRAVYNLAQFNTWVNNGGI